MHNRSHIVDRTNNYVGRTISNIRCTVTEQYSKLKGKCEAKSRVLHTFSQALHIWNVIKVFVITPRVRGVWDCLCGPAVDIVFQSRTW